MSRKPTLDVIDHGWARWSRRKRLGMSLAQERRLQAALREAADLGLEVRGDWGSKGGSKLKNLGDRERRR